MKIKKSFGENVFDITNAVILILLSLVTLYPFIYVVLASVSESNLLAVHTGFLVKPLGFSTMAYKTVFENEEIWTGYGNTIYYVIVGTAINIFMTSLGAYVTSKKYFFWNRILLPMIVFTMFFGGGLIPTFLLIKNLGLYNTSWAIILPGVISTWNMFIMKTSFSSIPDSLEESARIDGANEMIILFRIVLPLSMSTIAVMVLYYGVGHWNSWFSHLIYLKDRDNFPLQLFLREILIANSAMDMATEVGDIEKQSVAETIQYATIMVATLPVLCVYPFLQKYFVKGVLIGSVKG